MHCRRWSTHGLPSKGKYEEQERVCFVRRFDYLFPFWRGLCGGAGCAPNKHSGTEEDDG